ncbi:EAL domain-containing protein [Tumidithrix elongata RA019]|uniref:EAL domain-containing protein n=1 Tax=Tumidithrix elongata BACA0141 TaxID=2716417 RepID=A0AAW9PR55_9CYAN|nr:EAL domain-containing protein [Tumidithrix elongata RA019]
MKIQKDYRPLGCAECAGGAGLEFDFTMAFQPIVNTTTKNIFAYEALVRGLNNESAGQVFENVNDSNRYRFDQSCRTKAIKLAAHLGCQAFLSINFMPNAVYRPELCIRTTIEAAETFGFPISQIIFEITEGEKVEDITHVREIVQYYKAKGFKTAIDDFGAGYAGLNLLAELQTDIIKLDMALIRGIDQNKSRQAIVKGILQVCKELSITTIAEGVETYEELAILQTFGIELFQGYYFAKPAFQSLVAVSPSAFEIP